MKKNKHNRSAKKKIASSKGKVSKRPGVAKIKKKILKTSKTIKAVKTRKVVKKPVAKKSAKKVMVKKVAIKNGKSEPKKVLKTAKENVKEPFNPDLGLTHKQVKKIHHLSNEKHFSGPTGIKPYKPAKDELYMNPKQLEHFKNILNIWKEQLMSEMNRTVQHMKTNAANFPDPVDRASQEEEFNLELKTRERERRLIKKIDESLEKIQGGDYGFCFDCGAEIGIKRLEARPTATQCIECKTIAEIREKQTGG